MLRRCEPGGTADCVVCGEEVKFRARHRDHRVICNVYVKGVWNRVEHFHPDCYDGRHGKLIELDPQWIPKAARGVLSPG